MANQTQTKFNNPILIIVLLLLLIGSNLAWFLQNRKENNKADEKYQVVETELITTYAKLDSISRELNNKIAEIQMLGGKVDTLLQIKAQLEKEKKALLSGKKVSDAKYSELKSNIEGYEVLLQQKDTEIAKLREDNSFLTKEVLALKTDKVAKEDSLRALQLQKGEMSAVIKAAARLKAVNFRVVAVSEKDKKRDGSESKNEFRRRQVEKLEISFNIDENPAAKHGTRTIYMEVKDPDGATIFDNSTVGAASFRYEGKDLFYTSSKEIIFDNTKQLVQFSLVRKGEYKSGTYNVSFYCDASLIGSTQFIIR
jgi:hypothetical protein